MRIYFARHATDDDKYRGGWSNLDITADGVVQAENLARRLKQNQAEYGLNKIVSSDLLRARHTADIINRELQLGIEYSTDWRETNNGLLAGMKNSVAEAKFPGLYFSSLRMDETYPGGESPIAFFQRIERAFIDLCDNLNAGENVLVVTHSGVINIIYHIVQKKDWSNKGKSFSVPHASVHLLEKTDCGFTISGIKFR